jgi:uncharacterized protein with PQ loop repeat
MYSAIGWFGSVCFSLSALPQAYKSWSEGHSKGISWGLLILSFLGELCSLVYIYPLNILAFVINYVLNLVFLSIIIYYKLVPRG